MLIYVNVSVGICEGADKGLRRGKKEQHKKGYKSRIDWE